MTTTTRNLGASSLTLAALVALLLAAAGLLVWSAVFLVPARARRAATEEEGRQRAIYRAARERQATLVRRLADLDDLLLIAQLPEPALPRASAAPRVKPQASRAATPRPRPRRVLPVAPMDPPKVVTPPVRCAICVD